MNTTSTVPANETTEQLIARLTAENASLKAKAARKVTLKVSEKTGCISLYGFGRFPISAYRSQWAAIFAMADQITAFIEANKEEIDLLEALNKEAKASK
jgi:hypothetical protein